MNERTMAYGDIFLNGIRMFPLPFSTSRRFQAITEGLEQKLWRDDTIGGIARAVGRNFTYLVAQTGGVIVSIAPVIAGMAAVEKLAHYANPDFDGAGWYLLGATIVADMVYELRHPKVGSDS